MVFIEKVKESQIKFKGKVLNLRIDKVETKNGGTSQREIIEHPGAVAVVAVTDENKIVMVKQFRNPMEEVLLELPAGKMEKDEEPQITAARELKEETGYTARTIKHMYTYYSSPGCSNEKVHIYLATNLEEGEAEPDEHEHVEVEEYTLNELMDMIKDGTIIDGKSIIGVQGYFIK